MDKHLWLFALTLCVKYNCINLMYKGQTMI